MRIYDLARSATVQSVLTRYPETRTEQNPVVLHTTFRLTMWKILSVLTVVLVVCLQSAVCGDAGDVALPIREGLITETDADYATYAEYPIPPALEGPTDADYPMRPGIEPEISNDTEGE